MQLPQQLCRSGPHWTHLPDSLKNSFSTRSSLGFVHFGSYYFQ